MLGITKKKKKNFSGQVSLEQLGPMLKGVVPANTEKNKGIKALKM